MVTRAHHGVLEDKQYQDSFRNAAPQTPIKVYWQLRVQLSHIVAYAACWQRVHAQTVCTQIPLALQSVGMSVLRFGVEQEVTVDASTHLLSMSARVRHGSLPGYLLVGTVHGSLKDCTASVAVLACSLTGVYLLRTVCCHEPVARLEVAHCI